MAHQEPWLAQLDGLAEEFESHQIVQAEEQERADKEFYKILRDACDVVRDAEKNASPELPAIVEKAHSLLNDALDWAIGDDRYEFISCFSASKDAPEVEDSLEMCRSDIADGFVQFSQWLFPGAPLSTLPKFARTPAWTKSPRPHPFSTRLARFRESVASPASDETPLAQIIYQARAEASIDFTSAPDMMDLSSGGSILAMAGSGGWKGRDPRLHYYLLEDQDDDCMEGADMDPGLSNVARYVATDEERQLVFLADDDRIKSFSWAPAADGKVRSRLPNVHTMNSLRDFSGPISLLSNGRVARVGKGQAAIWTLDELEKHQDNPWKLIGEGKLNTDNSWRESGSKRIEMSSGTRPHSIVAFADDPTYAPTTLHVHAPSGHLLCGERRGSVEHSFGCVSIDLEHGGRRVTRYLGHGSDIERITTSAGDPNVFITAGSDGFARIFDLRRPMPVLSFNTGTQSEACVDVVFVHPDGISTLFTGGKYTEQVKVWDVRARSVVYELSTGNNVVSAMAWDARRSSLHVATKCTRMNRMGERSGYRKAQIPRWATWKAIENEAEALKAGTGASGVPSDTEDVAALEETGNAEVAKQDAVTENVAGAQPGQETAMDVIQDSPGAQVTADTTFEEDEDVTDAEKHEDYEEDEEDMDEDEMDNEDEEEDEDGMDDEDGGEDPDEEEESVEEEPDDIDEEYSARMRWPTNCYHKENFFGYAFDAGEDTLIRWQYKAEPNMMQVPPTSDFDF